MCIGLPMKVLAAGAGRARVAGRGEERNVCTALLGDVAEGEWLLVFLDGARERLSAERAAEVNATLDLLAGAMGGMLTDELNGTAAFALPSAMSAAELAALSGQPWPETAA